jgi:hypothetical protein
MLQQVRGEGELALQKAAQHGDAAAWAFGFVAGQDVRRAGREACAAAHAGQHVAVLGLQQLQLRAG